MAKNEIIMKPNGKEFLNLFNKLVCCSSYCSGKQTKTAPPEVGSFLFMIRSVYREAISARRAISYIHFYGRNEKQCTYHQIINHFATTSWTIDVKQNWLEILTNTMPKHFANRTTRDFVQLKDAIMIFPLLHCCKQITLWKSKSNFGNTFTP